MRNFLLDPNTGVIEFKENNVFKFYGVIIGYTLIQNTTIIKTVTLGKILDVDEYKKTKKVDKEVTYYDDKDDGIPTYIRTTIGFILAAKDQHKHLFD